MFAKSNKISELTLLRNQKYNSAAMNGLGMKWYKFNIYFRLFMNIIALLYNLTVVLLNCFNYWGVSWNIDVYNCLAIVFDVVLIAGAILTRYELVRFNKKGIYFYFSCQYLSEIVFFVTYVLLLGFNGESFGRLIAYAILFSMDYKYWKKRICLFGNSNESIHTYSNDESHKAQIKFCRKCGCKLLDNSDFCSQCGTKIIKNVEMIQNEVL